MELALAQIVSRTLVHIYRHTHPARRKSTPLQGGMCDLDELSNSAISKP